MSDTAEDGDPVGPPETATAVADQPAASSEITVHVEGLDGCHGDTGIGGATGGVHHRSHSPHVAPLAQEEIDLDQARSGVGESTREKESPSNPPQDAPANSPGDMSSRCGTDSEGAVRDEANQAKSGEFSNVKLREKSPGSSTAGIEEHSRKRNSLEIRNNIPNMSEVKNCESELTPDAPRYHSQGALPKMRKKSPGVARRLGDGPNVDSERDTSSSEKEMYEPPLPPASSIDVTVRSAQRELEVQLQRGSIPAYAPRSKLPPPQSNGGHSLSSDQSRDSGNPDSSSLDMLSDKSTSKDTTTSSSLDDLPGKDHDSENCPDLECNLTDNKIVEVENEYDYIKYARVQTGDSYVGMRLAYSTSNDSLHQNQQRNNNSSWGGMRSSDEEPYLGNNSSREGSPDKIHIHSNQFQEQIMRSGMSKVNEETLTEIPLNGSSDHLQSDDQKKNFSLSPEPTECDSAEVESVLSDEGKSSTSGMPMVEDGLSSSQGSDTEGDMSTTDCHPQSSHPSNLLKQRHKTDIEQMLQQRFQDDLTKMSDDACSMSITDDNSSSHHSSPSHDDFRRRNQDEVNNAIKDIKSAIQHSKKNKLKSPTGESDSVPEPIWVMRDTYVRPLGQQEELQRVQEEAERGREAGLLQQHEPNDQEYQIEDEDDEELIKYQYRPDGKTSKGFESDEDYTEHDKHLYERTRYSKGKNYASLAADDEPPSRGGMSGNMAPGGYTNSEPAPQQNSYMGRSEATLNQGPIRKTSPGGRVPPPQQQQQQSQYTQSQKDHPSAPPHFHNFSATIPNSRYDSAVNSRTPGSGPGEPYHGSSQSLQNYRNTQPHQELVQQHYQKQQQQQQHCSGSDQRVSPSSQGSADNLNIPPQGTPQSGVSPVNSLSTPWRESPNLLATNGSECSLPRSDIMDYRDNRAGSVTPPCENEPIDRPRRRRRRRCESYEFHDNPSDDEYYYEDDDDHEPNAYVRRRGPDGEYDTDAETDELLDKQYTRTEKVDIPELSRPPINRSAQAEKRRSRAREGEKESLTLRDPDNETVLIEGVLFRARYLGSTQLVTEGQPSRAIRMIQAQEAVGRIKAPEGENQPSTEVDLFVSIEKIMVLNTDLQEIMMDHALRTISYIADIGDLLVIMARRGPVTAPTSPGGEPKHQSKVCCHIFESDEAQLIAQSIGQAFQVAYMEFLKANGIDDPGLMKEIDYQEVLNQQEIFGEELFLFSNKDMQKEVIAPKLKGEPLGVVIVESGWGSMVPTVVLANMSPSGAAARCGQLNIGDQIMSINGVSLVGLPLSSCQTYIKAARNQTVVKLTVVSCPPVVEVCIKRPDVKYQLGFSVQNGVICSLLRGGIAERGGVRVGHRIIEINGSSVVAVPHEKIVSMLATSVGEITMKTMPTSIFRLLTGQDTPHYI